MWCKFLDAFDSPVVIERPMNRRKSNIAPGNIVPSKKGNLLSFFTDPKIRFWQASTVDNLHLADTRISQVQIIYRASLPEPNFGVGEETQEVALFAWDDIPWGDIAFPSVHWALNHYRAVEGVKEFAPHSNPQGDFGSF